MKICIGQLALVLILACSFTAFASTNAAVSADDGVAISSANSFDSTPTVEQINELDEANVLLVRDFTGWGTANEDILSGMPNVTLDIINSASLATTDFTLYDFVVIAGGQDATFNTNVNNSMFDLGNYVANGGWLQMHFGTNTHDPHLVLWDGTTYGDGTYFETENFTGPDGDGHPILAGMTEPFQGNYASHGYMTVYPLGSLIITVTSTDQPTFIEYNYGLGKVVCSTSPLEFNYLGGYSFGQALPNMMDWMVVNSVTTIVQPQELSADLDDQTGQVDLSWIHFMPDYFEDFEDGFADGWIDDGAGWGVEDGRYYVDWTPVSSNWTSSFIPIGPFSDGRFEAKVTRTVGDIFYANTLFINATGYYDPVDPLWDGYMISITNSGSFAIIEILDGVLNWIAFWQDSAAINTGLGAENVMSVEVDAGAYTFLINGVNVYSWAAGLPPGYVAVGCAADLGVASRVEWEYVGVDDGTFAVAENTLPAQTPISLPDNVSLAHAPETDRVTPRHNPTVSIFSQTQDELDDFVEFRIYRNGVMIGTTSQYMYTDVLPDFGIYNYTVTAFYDEGESDPAGPASVAWLDPTYVLIDEDFNAGIPDGWTIESYVGVGWFWDNGTGPALFPDGYMVVDSDGEGNGNTVQSRLISPAIGISGMTFLDVIFDHYFQEYIEEYGYFDYSVDGGATWNTILVFDTFTGYQTVTLDLTGMLMGEDEVLFSWYYDDIGNWGWWWGVDNFVVYTDGESDPEGPVNIDLIPVVDMVPSTGGQLIYDVHLWSNIGMSRPGLRYQTFATLPNGNVFGPIDNLPWNLNPYMDVYVPGRTINIPASAPAGQYYLEARAGVPNNPNQQITDGFPFWKQGAGYIETFNDGLAQNFSWYHGGGGTHTINGGYAKINQNGLDGWGSGVYTGSSFSDATTTVYFDYQAGDLSRGLLFRGDGPKDGDYNGYGFWIAPSVGGYALYKYTNGLESAVVYWTTTPLNPTTNTLTLVTSGSNFDMYLNGNYLGSVSDPDYASGYSGIVTYGSEVWFDEISVMPDVVLSAAQTIHEGEVLAGNYDDMGRPTDEVIPTTGAVVFDRSSEFTAEPYDFDGTGWVGGGPGFIAGEEAGIFELPSDYMVTAPYPNPFNPTTTVQVALPSAADLNVSVYNINGQLVSTLSSGMLEAGFHSFVFDAANLSSGIYFVTANVPGELNKVQKVTLMK